MAFGTALRNRWRQSFVLSITIVALVAVAVFAFLIGRIVANQIEDQALDRARETRRDRRALELRAAPARGRAVARGRGSRATSTASWQPRARRSPGCRCGCGAPMAR